MFLDYIERRSVESDYFEGIDFSNREINKLYQGENIKRPISLRSGFIDFVGSYSYLGYYNGEKAANWAYNHAYSFSTLFPNMNSLGGDCANFVSQAMHMGGNMPMQGNWYCNKKNSSYPMPSSSYQLDYSWDLADPSPWISAREFHKFWQTKTKYKYFGSKYFIANHKEMYYDDIKKGDAISFINKDLVGMAHPQHTMIVVGYDRENKEIILAGHTENTRVRRLTVAASNYSGFRVFKFRK